MKLLFVIAVCLICLGVTAQADVTITSDSLPYDMNIDGERYILASDITSDSFGIFVSCIQCTLDFQGYDLYYNDADLDDVFGMRIARRLHTETAHDVVIRDGGIISANTDSTADRNIALEIAGAWGVKLVNMYIQANGQDAQCIETEPPDTRSFTTINSGAITDYNGDNEGLWIDSCTIHSDVNGYTSRCSYDGAAAHFGLQRPVDSLQEYEYNFLITNTDVTNSPGQGIVGSGILQVKDCSTYVDMRNSFYTYPSGGFCFSATNAACYLFTDVVAPAYCSSSVGVAGDSHNGCDVGILIENSQPSSLADTCIYDNLTFFLHSDSDAYYGITFSKCVKTRFGNKNHKITRVNCECYAGDSDTRPGYGGNIAGIEVLTNKSEGGESAEHQSFDTNCVITNNHFNMIVLDSNIDRAAAARICAPGAEEGYTWERAGNYMGGNYYKSNHIAFQWGHNLDGDVDSFLTSNDTFVLVDSGWSNITPYTFYLGVNVDGLDYFGNVARDGIYQGTASDTNIGCFPVAPDYGMIVQYTCSVLVWNKNSQPVPSCSVFVFEGYNASDTASRDSATYSGLTDANGLFTAEMITWQEFCDVPDSDGYNDFTIVATTGDDYDAGTITYGATIKKDTRVLSNTGQNVVLQDAYLRKGIIK